MPKPKKNINQTKETLLTQSHAKHDRSPTWTAIVTVVYLLAIVLSLAYYQLILTSILTLAAIVYFLVANIEPRRHNLAIKEKSLAIDGRTLPFETLRWFRLFYTPAGFMIELQPVNRVKMPIGLHLSPGQASTLFKKLSNRVPFHFDVKETISDRLNRWFRI